MPGTIPPIINRMKINTRACGELVGVSKLSLRDDAQDTPELARAFEQFASAREQL